MTGGKFVVAILVACAAAAGIGIWYTQTRAYHTEAPVQATVRLTDAAEATLDLPVSGFTAIETVSSPLGFRACFTFDTPPDPAATVPYEGATPLIAPGWFGCFDAGALDEALAAGEATAVLGTKNIAYGVDRIVALFPDGRGYAWHQLNNCGRKAYDGSPVGEACPPRDDAPAGE